MSSAAVMSTGSEENSSITVSNAESGSGDLIVDRAAVLDRVGGDEDLLREIIVIFLQEYPTLVAEIRRGLTNADARVLESAAHTLKGCVANFGARSATHAALELEKAGRRGELDRAPALVAHLHVELASLENALKELL